MNITSVRKLISGRVTVFSGPACSRMSFPGVGVRLFITCWLLYAAHFATNTVREIYPAITLGERASFDVSEYVGLHSDIFELPGRGAFINNNPGASILGAIPYAVASPLVNVVADRVNQARAASPASTPRFDTPFPGRGRFYAEAYERGLDVKLGLAAGVIQVFLMAPVSALSVVVMFFVLLRLSGAFRASLALALLYGLATPLFYRTAQLNHNLLLAHFAFFAFVVLGRPWDDRSRPKPPRYLLAGLLAGWTLVLDYSGIVAVIALGAYAVVRWTELPEGARSRLDLARFALGVALAGAVLAAYQWSSFGNPLFPAQRYMADTQFSGQGFFGLDWPSLDLLWRTAFDIKFGLFVFAPILVLSLYPPAWLSHTRLVAARETWFIALFTAAFLLFSAANQFGYMQFNTGVRHIVPVTPFLFLVVAGVVLRLPPAPAVIAGFAATYWSWSLAMYREVGDGHPLGAIDAVTRVTFDGVRLPWLTTLEYLGYVSSSLLAVPVLLLLGGVIWLVWSMHVPAALGMRSHRAQSH